ncbi:unnamed protein product, partial [Larinioides sclopetarius]
FVRNLPGNIENDSEIAIVSFHILDSRNFSKKKKKISYSATMALKNDFLLFMEFERTGYKNRFQVEDLISPPDIVQHSFIVQHSLTPLDLEISQSYRYMTKILRIPSRKAYNRVINTEEKCQKLHAPTRKRLIYKLNLDLPKTRQWSLKQESPPRCTTSCIVPPLIAGVVVRDVTYTSRLAKFFFHACVKIDDNEKIMKWFMKRNDLKPYFTEFMNENALSRFVDRMLLESTDLELVKTCLRGLPLRLLTHEQNPGRVRDLLYLAHRRGGRLEREILSCHFADYCFSHYSLMFVGEVLKFLNAPHLCQGFLKRLSELISEIRHEFYRSDSARSMRGKNERRYALLQHLHWTYLSRSHNPSAASESLQLIWNSVPDPFITCSELFTEFQRLEPEENASMYDFYAEAVGDHDDVEPRSLKHLCRCAIRYQLWICMQWLPEGIEKTGLPASLQSYLKLEKQVQ